MFIIKLNWISSKIGGLCKWREQKDGITLVALIITIIVLIIIAGITIGITTGERETINTAKNAKIQKEINEELTMVIKAGNESRNKNKYGDITEDSLKKALDTNTKKGKTLVNQYSDFSSNYGFHTVTFTDSNRIYRIDENGDVEILGNENELEI